MVSVIVLAGIASAAILAACLVWSILYPGRRIWPPEPFSRPVAVAVWTLTVVIIGSALILGVAGWGEWPVPVPLRWIGAALALAGNVAVWSQVLRIGLATTSGMAGGLETGGLYRFSRHPQYVADIAILAGWAVLSAAPLALPVAAAGIVVLALAPYAEEPWLRRRYGGDHDAYRSRVRRFI